MTIRAVILPLAAAAAACAAALAAPALAQDRTTPRTPSWSTGPTSGMLGILRHGDWECALPGDAGGEAFVPVPEEAFRIGTASSYINPEGNGIYLLRGTEVLFTRGPKKDQRFKVLGDNTLQKLNPDGSLSRLICTRVSAAR